MSRRKITEEAQEAQETAETSESKSSGERQQTTWRADEELLAELDELADRYGMSRNAAITMLVRDGLDSR